MAELRDKVFSNTGTLSEEAIRKYKLKAIEDIDKDLAEFGNWDISTPVATVALVLNNEDIEQAVLNLHGESDPKRIDAGVIFGDDYKGGEDHMVRIGKVELKKFCFRGSLVSNWLGPQDFPHTIQRPSSTQTGLWRDIEPQRVEADGGQPLWMRAVLQPWSGLKLRMTLGVFAVKDVNRVQESSHHRFPFISLLSVNIPILPIPPNEEEVCLPFVPYVIDGREDDENNCVPTWAKMVKAVNGMFRGTSAPHSKSSMSTLKEALRGDWKTEKPSKHVYPVLQVDEEAQEEPGDGGRIS